MKKLIVLLILAVGAYFGTTWYLHWEVSGEVDKIVTMVSPYAEVEYSGIRSTIGGELTVEDVTIRMNGFRDPIVIDRIGIDAGDFLKLLDLNTIYEQSRPIDYLGFIVENLRVSTNADYFRVLYALGEEELGREPPDDPAKTCAGQYGLSPALLTDLGYTDQVYSMRFGVHRQDGGSRVTIEMETEDMWEAKLDFQIDGDLPTRGSNVYRARMKTMRIEYTDRSLNERVQKNCARRGLTEEQIVEAQIDTLKRYGMESGIEFDEYVIDPYIEFLNGKSTIVFTAAPNEPIAFSQIDLYKPSDVPALLKLEAKAL